MACQHRAGDNTRIDLTVGDIYGQDYGKVGLPSHIIASTYGFILLPAVEHACTHLACLRFGKVIYEREKERKNSAGASQSPQQPWSKEDATASLLKMICNNIAQIAYHNAMRNNIKRIYFGGFFIRNHHPTMFGISMGIKYWSHGTIQVRSMPQLQSDKCSLAILKIALLIVPFL